MKRPLVKTADIIFIALCIAATVLLTVRALGGEKGQTVIVAKDGKTVFTMPLDTDQTRSVGQVTVTVKDGEAYISHSDCRDKICMRTRLKKAGDTSVCMPNRVTVTVSGQPDTDAVTY